MATTTALKEVINAEGKPIKLAVAYDDEVHAKVCSSPIAIYKTANR
jgi:hypothetical protein